MKRVLGRFLTIGVVAIGSPVLAPAGCAQNDQSIYVRDTLAPPQNRQNGECIYLPDPTAPFLAQGTLDVDARDSYVAYLLVGSQLLSRGDTTNTRAESNRAHLNGAVVSVTNPDGTEINSFTATGTGFIDPQTANTASFGILAVTAIDAVTSGKIGGSMKAGDERLVLANIKAFGTTLGGVDLESGEYQFPIRVCKSCLLSFATGDDPAVPGRDCNLALNTTSSSATSAIPLVIPCNPGQDEITPCQLCNDGAHPACSGK